MCIILCTAKCTFLSSNVQQCRNGSIVMLNLHGCVVQLLTTKVIHLFGDLNNRLAGHDKDHHTQKLEEGVEF